LGSKNKIFLGLISDIIFHFMRNVFSKKELHITKNKYNKIAEKHPEVKTILNDNFQIIINNTFATCEYGEDGLYNFISIMDDKYIIFAISSNNFHTEVATLFYAKKRLLRKCVKSVKFFNEKAKIDFIEYLN